MISLKKALLLGTLSAITTSHAQDTLPPAPDAPAPPELPAPKPPQKALIANPAEDLYLAARHAYQEAIDTKDARLKKQFYGVAGRQFTKFIHKHAGHKKEQSAWYYLALCNRGMGSPENAFRCFNTLVEKWPKGQLSGLAAYQLADRDYKDAQYEKAAQNYLLAAKESGHEKTAQLSLFKRALCFQKLGDKAPQGALATALRTVSKDPANPYTNQATQALAYLLRDQGDHAGALALFQKLRDLPDPKLHADGLLQTALLATKLKQTELAQACYYQIFETPGLEKWQGEAQLALMNYHHEAKLPDFVIKEYERGNPSKQNGHFKLSGKAHLRRLMLAVKAYEATDQKEKTLPLYTQIAKADPSGNAGYEAGYLTIASKYPNDKNFARDAERFLKTHRDKNQNDARIHNLHLMLGETYYGNKDYKRAAAQYEQINFDHLHPDSLPSLHYKLADCQHQLGNFTTALAAWSYYLKTYSTKLAGNTRLLTAHSRRAEIYEKKGLSTDALNEYNKIISLNAANAQRPDGQEDPQWKLLSLLHKINIYKKTNNLTRFIGAHQTVLTSFPDRPAKDRADSHFWLGWAHFRLKDFPTAITQLRTTRELDPKSYAKETSLHLLLSYYSLEQAEPLETELKHHLKHHRETAAKLPKALYAWSGVQAAKQKRYADAHPFLKRALTPQTPADTNPTVWKSAAISAIEIHHYQDALFPLQHLLDIETSKWTRAQLYQLQARSYLGLKQFDDALNAANNGLEIKPVGELNTKLRLNLGDAHLGLNQPEEAAKHFVVVTELITDNPALKKEATQKAIQALQAIGDENSLQQATRYQEQLNTP